MNFTHKTYRNLNIVLLILAMACLIYYDYAGGLALKGITSGWFVVLGVVNLALAHRMRYHKMAFMWLVMAALFLTMVADVVLGIHFMLGTIIFAAGHICYFAAYCALERFCKRDLIPVAVAAVISLIAVLGTPFIQVEDPVMRYLLIGYAIVISCMVGKAVGNLVTERSRTRLLVVIGSILFWFSDLMLALNLFGSGGSLASTLCLYTYWPGQYLLAHTLYHFAVSTEE